MKDINKSKEEIKQLKIKKFKIGRVLLMIFFIVFVFGLLYYIFFIYRPFVKWTKITFSKIDGSFSVIHNDGFLASADGYYEYTIDGVKYEKIVKNIQASQKGVGKEALYIYVNKNNPNDVKRGSDGDILPLIISFVLIPCFGLCFWYAVKDFRNPEKALELDDKTSSDSSKDDLSSDDYSISKEDYDL